MLSLPAHAAGWHGHGHSPMLMGIIYGIVHVVGPDHLGTLMTLSTVTSSHRAFRVGAAWGLGHSVGMVTVGVLMILMHQMVTINMEKWEYYGNYFIGTSMILCGLYFMLREGAFLKQSSDGTLVPQPCSCHGTVTLQRQPRRGRRHQHAPRFCTSYCPSTCEKGEDAEKEPLVPQESDSSEKGSDAEETRTCWGERDVKGALLGMFQGTCCPLGMVGMTFLANLPVHGVIGFLLMFLLVSAFGTATLAAGWAYLTSSGIGHAVNPRLVYRASCFFTLSLGITWVVANRCGILRKLDYTEGMHTGMRA